MSGLPFPDKLLKVIRVSIALIVGLGNPGSRYVATRHNVGFLVVDNLAVQAKTLFRNEKKFFGEVNRVEFPPPPPFQRKELDIYQTNVSLIEKSLSPCWLLKAHTFMNNSGQAVSALANYYKIPVEQILVIHDDLDFPPGTVRLKKGGSDCKHNGLKSIIAHLGSHQFLRLRFGIGHPGRSAEVTNYVLGIPSREEQTVIEEAMSAALEAMPLIVAGELDKAMQQLHTRI